VVFAVSEEFLVNGGRDNDGAEKLGEQINVSHQDEI